jgi:pilus assembly protein CpaE
LLATREEIQILGYPRDGLEAAQMSVALKPNVVLIHDRLPEMSGGMACELIAQAAPGVATVLICDRTDPATLQRGMRSGARAVVSPLTSADELAALLRDLAEVSSLGDQREFRLVTDPTAMPVTIAMISARDGVGKSTLAANLAVTLAGRFPGEVALVDLCGQFGTVGILLNLRPTHNVVDLAGFVGEMDAELVDTFLERHASGLRVLAGGQRPDPAWTDAVSVGFVARLLGLLRRRYSYIICDVPALVWPGGLYAISRAQCSLVVTSLSDVTCIRETAALVEMLAPAHVAPEFLHTVVSRVSSHDWFSEDDVRSATRRPVWHSQPNDSPGTFAAANEGVPLVLSKPNTPYAKAVGILADKVTAEVHHTA